MENVPMIFEVTVFGDLKPFSETISRARVRIFYKGLNRNATYITEEFATKLLSSLSYTPVKGIFEEDDYINHGKQRTEGRVYGVTMENPNVTWEDHLDDDGVTRKYACADVLLYTALYPEAKDIIGKAQSMEIYPPSIKGEWQMIENKRLFVYTEGCFLGLQVLGEEVEPCFEGSEFFSLYKNLKVLVDEIKGGKRMINFKFSDSTKHDMLFNLINPNFNESGNWTMEYGICDVYEDYALCYSYETGSYCRWYYEKEDETDEVTLVESKPCKVIDVTEEEYQALNLLKAANSNTFEKVDEVFAVASEKIDTLTIDLATQVEAFNLKEQELISKDETIVEKELALTAQLESFTSLQATLDATVIEKDSSIATLSDKVSELEVFKKSVEDLEKMNILTKFTALLDSEVVETFKAKLEEFNALDLQKELALIAFEKNPNVFEKGDLADNAHGYIPSNEEPVFTGATKILMKHKKK